MLANNAYRNEREELHPNEMLQAMPNEATGLLTDRAIIDTFPRYRLIKIMRSLVSLAKATAYMLTYLYVYKHVLKIFFIFTICSWVDI